MIEPVRAPNVVALINLSSATTEDISAPLSALLRRYGYAEAKILKGPASEMPVLIEDMRASSADLLIGYGGDGTCSAVAQLARDQNKPFLPLPGGTMNLLMNGLYGTADWQTCLLQGLACAAPRPLAAGRITDDSGEEGRFLVGCMIGRATRFNNAREQWRDGKKVVAAKDALELLSAEAKPALLRINAEDMDPIEVEFINIVCPFMQGRALDPDRLNVTLFDTVTGGSALTLGLAVLIGNLQQSEVVKSLKLPRFTIESDHQIEVLLDGEPKMFGRQVTIELDPDWGQVLAPWPAISFPQSDRERETG